MANANKVKKAVVKSSKFLPEEIKNLEDKGEVYSLEEEYAKTKKNKNYKLYLFILSFITIVVFGTLFFTGYLKKKTENYNVNINEFQDLRLKEALKSANTAETNLTLRIIELEVLRTKLKNAILDIKRRSLRKEISVLSSGLSNNIIDNKIKAIKKVEKRQIIQVRIRFRRKLYKIKNEIYNIRKALKISTKESKNKKTVKTDDPEKKLQKLRLKQLKRSHNSGLHTLRIYYNRYINYQKLKYNPRFTTGKLATIINTNKNKKIAYTAKFKAYDAIYQREKVISKKLYNQTIKQMKHQNLLLKRLKRVGYINSIPSAIKSIENLSNSVFKEFNYIVSKTITLLKLKNSIIYQRTIKLNNYKNAINLLLQSRFVDGVILKVINKNVIYIHMNKNYIKVGTQATVYRNAKQIALIQITKGTGNQKAKLVGIFIKGSLQPFDDIKLFRPRKKVK